jgi:hypothetical protein
MVGNYRLAWGPRLAIAREDYGECRLTRIDDMDGSRIEVIRADPRVLIDAAVLQDRERWLPCATLVDGILRIEAANRTVIYRIGQYLPDHDAWEAEWPD